MSIDQLIAAADALAAHLESISRRLDEVIHIIESAEDRGALSRMQRVAHDAANALHRPH